ncbi:MAG: ribose 5-phosphate isomerase A [Actinomycetota bacterium]|nr:ribose 5-phosphate isomerase A [Actinomycetota bacterium]
MGADTEHEKDVVGRSAAQLIEDGMTVGLGTGSTALRFLRALADRELEIGCVATSPATEAAALGLGLRVEPFGPRSRLTRLDIAVDGADQVTRDGWVVKGGGGAHTREKIVAAAAERFVVIVSSDKIVDEIGPPVPLELNAFGAASTVDRLGSARLRDADTTLDGGSVLADWVGSVKDPAELAALLASTPGVVEHGLFPPELVTEILVARGDEVECLAMD